MRLTRTFLGVAALGLVACGGSDGGSFSSGVDPSKSAGQVTDAEAKQICEASINYFNGQFNPTANKADMCKFAAALGASLSGALGGTSLPDAQLQMLCKQVYDQCMMTDLSSEYEAPNPAEECATPDKPGATCTATVGEYEQCLSDSVGVFKSTLNSVPSCSQLTNAWLQSQQNDNTDTTPVSCKTFQQKCPGEEVPDFGDILDFSGEDLDEGDL